METPPPPPPVVDLDIINFTFRPGEITIPKGTTLRWTNKDAAPHTATSDTGVFNTGTLSKNQAAEFTFTESGTYTYKCTIHPWMKATIIVE